MILPKILASNQPQKKMKKHTLIMVFGTGKGGSCGGNGEAGSPEDSRAGVPAILRLYSFDVDLSLLGIH